MRSPRPYKPTWFIKATIALHILALVFMIVLPAQWHWALVAILINHVFITVIGLSPRSQALGPNWTQLPKTAIDNNQIALTIDDGPDPQVTPQVLELLDRYQVKATFFCIGDNIARYPDLAQAIIARGHIIENHSQHHHHQFSLLGVQAFKKEIAAAQQTIKTITGQCPQFFRAPAGLRNPFLEPALAALGLTLASWTVRGFDTRTNNVAVVKRRLLNKLAAGAIILIHDGNAAKTKQNQPIILEVLPDLLEAAQAKHLQWITLRQAIIE